MKNLNKKSLKDFKSKSLKNSYKIVGGTDGPKTSRGTKVTVKSGAGIIDDED